MSFDIERYLNIRSAYGASVGPGGDRVAFLLNTTGVAQAWSLKEPGEWPTQHTFFEDRVTFIDYSPTRSEFVVGSDTGGNERVQFFFVDPDDGTIENLTQTPEAKHRWGGFDEAGDRFAFTSNRRDEAVFDLYVQDREETGDDATLVYEGDGWLSPVEWHPEDESILLHKARSSFDHEVLLYDCEDGQVTRLTAHPDENRYASPTFAPDGESIYLVSDEDADTLSLCQLDPVDGSLTTLADGGNWNVTSVAIDHDSEAIVYARNVDGYTELTTGRLTGGELTVEATPELCEGVAGGVSFFPEGERFAITVHGRRNNPNVFVVDLASGATERWTAAPTAGIPRESFIAPELIHFESFDGREIPALYSVPPNADAGDTPVIVDIHGGPESQRRPGFSTVQQYFLGQGYAIFEPNVRGSTGYGREYTHLDDVENRMDSVADIEAGLDWLRDHPIPDPDRFVALGGSYGGFMVLASLTEYPDSWAAGIDIVGIANFVTFLENTGDWRRELREAEYGRLEEDRAFLESISPINNIESIEAPLYVLHGENDPRVPVGEAKQIAEQAREQGVPVRTLIFEDEGHGFAKLENRIEAYRSIAAFLEEHV